MLEKYNEIWKIQQCHKKINGEPVHNKKISKSKN